VFGCNDDISSLNKSATEVIRKDIKCYSCGTVIVDLHDVKIGYTAYSAALIKRIGLADGTFYGEIFTNDCVVTYHTK